jgi:hypothetical protein
MKYRYHLVASAIGNKLKLIVTRIINKVAVPDKHYYLEPPKMIHSQFSSN